jgi:hypothetical protein
MILQVLGAGTANPNSAPAVIAAPAATIAPDPGNGFTIRAETIDSFERATLAPWTTRSGTFYWAIRDTTNTYGPNTHNLNGYRYAGVPAQDIAEYPDGQDTASLVSPTIDLTGWDSLFVSFAYWADPEGVTDNFDGFIVEISTDNGATWRQVDSSAVGHLNPTYDHRLTGGGILGIRWAYCYDRHYWVNVASVNLIAAGYAAPGQQTKIRFKFAKDDLSGGQGIFIDDVRFADTPPPDLLAPVITTTPLSDNPDTLLPMPVIATVTDIGTGVNPDSVYLHYQVETGPWIDVKMTNTAADTYQATIPRQSYHTDIFYNITAFDLATPPNGSVSPTYNFEVTNALSIRLDDGQPYWGYSLAAAGNGLFTQFPLNAVGLDSGWLHQVKFFFDGRGPFDLQIYDWNGSMPGTMIGSVTDQHCPGYGWCTVDITDLNLHVVAEVVAGFIINSDPVDTLCCMLDPTQGYPERLWGWYNGAWVQTLFGGGDMMEILKVIPLPLPGVEEKPGKPEPQVLSLNPAVPNPARYIATIGFQLPVEQDVRLTMYNAAGQQVRTLVNGRLAAGSHQVVWNACDDAGRSVANGVYFYRLSAGAKDLTGKLVVTK